MKANAEHFFKALEHCIKCKFTRHQAMVMSRCFSRRGLIDAGEGCSHYALMTLRPRRGTTTKKQGEHHEDHT
jgi:hypothetical protein